MAASIDGPPVVVGGVGGSGTRVICQLLISLGVFMGDRLNESNDNMTYAAYSERVRGRLRSEAPGAPSSAGDYPFDFADSTLRFVELELSGFIEENRQAFEAQATSRAGWGWKVPGMFHLLRPLSAVLGPFKYLHVIRNGLDMAFSDNQNQVSNWGWRFGIRPEGQPTPAQSLRYWTRANRQAVIDAERYGADLLVLNFDRLCLAPSAEIARMASHLGLAPTSPEALAALVRAPATIGRRGDFDLSFVDDEDRAALRQFGFE